MFEFQGGSVSPPPSLRPEHGLMGHVKQSIVNVTSQSKSRKWYNVIIKTTQSASQQHTKKSWQVMKHCMEIGSLHNQIFHICTLILYLIRDYRGNLSFQITVKWSQNQIPVLEMVQLSIWYVKLRFYPSIIDNL